jgi:hypothetical protein
MASRGTQFAKAMAYFRTGDIDEVEAALAKATDIVEERQAPSRKPRQARQAKRIEEATVAVRTATA